MDWTNVTKAVAAVVSFLLSLERQGRLKPDDPEHLLFTLMYGRLWTKLNKWWYQEQRTLMATQKDIQWVEVSLNSMDRGEVERLAGDEPALIDGTTKAVLAGYKVSAAHDKAQAAMKVYFVGTDATKNANKAVMGRAKTFRKALAAAMTKIGKLGLERKWDVGGSDEDWFE